MSPEKAKVFVAEDDETWQKFIKIYLEEAGHSVVATARTIEEAMEIIEKLEEMGIDVAVLDGNLNEDEYKGFDGMAMLRKIRDTAKNVKTVGMSGNSVPGTDVDLGKRKVSEIGKVVTNL